MIQISCHRIHAGELKLRLDYADSSHCRLYETRLASANLADWLKQSCDFFAGPAAFDLA